LHTKTIKANKGLVNGKIPFYMVIAYINHKS
jgi:hypothetical protein